jgi:hypothetical protein
MRGTLLFISLVTLVSFARVAGDDISAASAAGPRVAAIDKLDSTLSISDRAQSLDLLVRQTKPKFVWRTRDMLWIAHDERGKVGFVMNRAYDLQIGSGNPVCCLLVAHDYYVDAGVNDDNPVFPFTRGSDPKPIIVARDPARGVIYQARWASAPYAGSGSVTETRNLFFLCDGQHRWHFLEEGPISSSDCMGADDYLSSRVEATITWTDNALTPVKLRFVLADRDVWNLHGADPDAPGLPSITIRHRMVAAPAKDDDDAADAFTSQGLPFVVAERSEALDDLLRRVDRYKQDTVRQLRVEVGELNPSLGPEVYAGEEILLPSRFQTNEY